MNEEKIENKCFYDGIVSKLKTEAVRLNERLEKCNFKMPEDYNRYISLLKSLRETLELIKKYDWQIRWSENIVETDGISFEQLSIWEESEDGNIRYKHVWNTDKILDNLIGHWKYFSEDEKSKICLRMAGKFKADKLREVLDNLK